jgi:hypothetical protein
MLTTDGDMKVFANPFLSVIPSKRKIDAAGAGRRRVVKLETVEAKSGTLRHTVGDGLPALIPQCTSCRAR